MILIVDPLFLDSVLVIVVNWTNHLDTPMKFISLTSYNALCDEKEIDKQYSWDDCLRFQVIRATIDILDILNYSLTYTFMN